MTDLPPVDLTTASLPPVVSDPEAMLIAQTQGMAPDGSDPISGPFWEGAAAGELRYQFCEACDLAIMDPQPACPKCLKQPSWNTSAGQAAIESYSVVWRAPLPHFAVPYAPALVRLSEGFSMLTNIIDCRVKDIAVGTQVQVQFREVAGGTLPYFAPLAEPTSNNER